LTRAAFIFCLALSLAQAALAAENAPASEGPKANVPPGMVLVPAGEFTMGRTRSTPDDETGMRPLALRDDRPAHPVELDAFHIDAKEVTHAAYAEFVTATGRPAPRHWLGGKIPPDMSEVPIYNVDLNDANAYCGWAGKRLPFEAEWEKAARGGQDGLDFPWGDDKPSEALARFNTPLGPTATGKRKPNPYGIYDMAGSVAEWCGDWFERTYYETSPRKNPTGPESGLYKVIRGGAWSDGPNRITVFFRNWVRPNQKTPNIGFRCVSNAPPEEDKP
jgi:formylglycine-generating enzyme required for sulfatase activity